MGCPAPLWGCKGRGRWERDERVSILANGFPIADQTRSARRARGSDPLTSDSEDSDFPSSEDDEGSQMEELRSDSSEDGRSGPTRREVVLNGSQVSRSREDRLCLRRALSDGSLGSCRPQGAR